MRFGFRRTLAWAMSASALLFASAAVLSAAAFSAKHQIVSGLVLLIPFGSFSILSFRSARRLFDHVAVNANGIWYVPRMGQSTFLAWHDVGTVVADDVGQRLVIVDAAGRTTIRLEYQLQQFSRLREFVLSHSPNRERANSCPITTFHRTWINKLVFVLFSATLFLVAWIAGGQGQWGASAIFAVFATTVLLLITLDPVRVMVEPQGIVIAYPGWKREIPFSQITDISLVNEKYRGNVFAAVVIRRSQGKPIKLYRFQEGSLALHQTLKAAWNPGTDGMLY